MRLCNQHCKINKQNPIQSLTHKKYHYFTGVTHHRYISIFKYNLHHRKCNLECPLITGFTVFQCRKQLVINKEILILKWHLIQTRLLGRPQPQMYPPVALNQYTWVNRTHKHFFIYASRPHENFEIDFTPKLSSQQHVKYGSNLMKNVLLTSF